MGVSGIGLFQNHAVVGDPYNRLDFSNAMAFIQKADGVIQYYVQVGGYSFPDTRQSLYQLHKSGRQTVWGSARSLSQDRPTDNFSIEAGNLPTLFGAEYTFTFENMNVERGLLWNQGERHQSWCPAQL